MSLAWTRAAQALGDATANIGASMFSNAIERDKEARLQQIADKQWSRQREADLADMDRNEAFQTGLLEKRYEQDALAREEARKHDRFMLAERNKQAIALEDMTQDHRLEALQWARDNPDHPLGTALQERDKHEEGTEEWSRWNNEVLKAALVPVRDIYGNTTFSRVEDLVDENTRSTDNDDASDPTASRGISDMTDEALLALQEALKTVPLNEDGSLTYSGRTLTPTEFYRQKKELEDEIRRRRLSSKSKGLLGGFSDRLALNNLPDYRPM